MNEQKTIILPDDPRAASFQTVAGWVSRNGRFFGGSEHGARYDGSTHRKCDCGEIIEKNGYCRKCYARRRQENFEKMEQRPWNGTDTLYSQSDDWYFFDRDALDQYCEEYETTPESLRLIICVPIYAKGIDPVEYYHDDLPDDKDEKVPDEIWEAFKELNARLEEAKVILSWYPGKYAASLVDKKGE